MNIFVKILRISITDSTKRAIDVVNIIPLNIGSSEPNHALLKNGAHNYLGDTGYSITRGAVVVGKLRESQS